MDENWRSSLWQQFGAAIDMLDNAVAACPDELWRCPPVGRCRVAGVRGVLVRRLSHPFLARPVPVRRGRGFAPPAPFTLDELDPAGLLPDRPYTRDELQAYLEHGREKCRATIDALTDEQASRRCKFPWGEVSFAGCSWTTCATSRSTPRS